MGWRNLFSKLGIYQRDSLGDARSADRRVLQQLSNAGVDLRGNVEVLHYLYLPSRAVAEEIAERLTAQKYQVTVRPAANADEKPPNPWLLLASRSEEINEEKIGLVREHMEELVGPAGGEYDGWEVAVPSQ